MEERYIGIFDRGRAGDFQSSTQINFVLTD